jgi:hypothetical protein
MRSNLTPGQYRDNVIAAIQDNLDCRLFYFPPDRARRREMNLRLAREFGYGLKDFPDLNGVLSTLYSTMVVRFSLDTTGVAVDAAEFIAEVQHAMKYQNLENKKAPEGAERDSY